MAQNKSKAKSFVEVQRVTQWYIWIIPILVCLLCLSTLFVQVVFQRPVGDKPVSNLTLVLLTLIPSSILLLLKSLRMTTQIDANGISVNLVPLSKKYMAWDEIRSTQIIQYKFSGYGLRFSTKYGTIFNMKGTRGLQIELKSGEKVLLGTMQGDDMKKVLVR